MSLNSTARLITVVFLLLLPSCALEAQLLPEIAGAPASLSHEWVPAAGRHTLVLTVERFGRYAVTVASEEGVALQLVDRMAGPGAVTGSAGAEDGRLDLFLDRGEYQIVTQGHPRASGEARLAVHAFTELNPSPAPQLVELKPIEAELRDFEQRSYWLEITQRSWFSVEAAGRALVDLRLWQEGTWLHDAMPEIEVLDPVVGQPLQVCRLVVELEPGLYMLSAYGGRPQPWAEEAEHWPLHLRAGIPELAQSGRTRFEISPFGYDRFLVPARANFYRVELAEQRPTELRVLEHEESRPFARWGDTASIQKDSREPMAEIDTGGLDRGGFNQVVVQAEAGQPYILQHFESREWYSFSGSGDYWVSSVHAGHAEDSVDATGIVAHWRGGGQLDREPLAEQTITIGSESAWSTRCNLLDTLNVFLFVADTGAYTVESQGVEARFRIEPFFVYRPRDYQTPPWRQPGTRWDLDAGYYVLSVDPVDKGILEMVVKPSGVLNDLLDLVGFGAEVDDGAVRGSVRFPSLKLRSSDSYRLYLNRQPGVRAGLVLRRLPLDPSLEALPLTLRPDEQVTVPVRLREQAELTAPTEDGQTLEISVDNGPWRPRLRLDGGRRYTLSVRNRAEATRMASLNATPVRLLASAELPPLPQASLDGLPDFPVLAAGAPSFFDLDRGQRTTFLVQADEDALYRLETTGLLNTSGTVRSRTVSSLASSSSGGSGRNFFLHQYLLSGDYQLRVSALGRSAGHLGLQLTPTYPSDGGELEPGLPARRLMAAGESVVYRFSIAEPGTYHLRSMALGRSLRCRLEDGDGWPLMAPNSTADIRRSFEAGEYRLVVLPEPVDGRRLTLLERLADPPRFEGHGPHALPLDRAVKHRWMEPAEGEARLPDSWRFSLPARTVISFELSPEMAGVLFREGPEGDEKVGEIAADHLYEAAHEAGAYRLELVSERANNLLDYHLKVVPEALVAGVTRSYTVPRTVPLVIGAASPLVQISSFGVADVAARLVDSGGRVVAFGDDRPGDWNFVLDGRFSPGEYELELLPVGSAQASTTVSVTARKERLEEARRPPFELELEPRDEVVVIPLEGLSRPLLAASARSAATVGLALEYEDGAGSWLPLVNRVGRPAVLEAPLAAGTALRLRVWSVDRNADPLQLQVMEITPETLSEAKLARGIRLQALPGLEPARAIYELKGAPAGVLSTSTQELRWSADGSEALAPVQRGTLALVGERAFVAVPVSAPGQGFSARRVELAADRTLQLSVVPERPVRLDLATSRAEAVLMLSSAVAGQPTLRLADDRGSTALSASAMEADSCLTATLEPGQRRQLQLELLSGSEAADLSFERHDFSQLTEDRIGFGSHALALERGRGLRLRLPGQVTELRLALSPGVAAALASDDRVESLHWGGEHGLVVELASGAEELVLLPTADGHCSAELVPAGKQVLELRDSAPLARTMVRRGRLRIPVAPGAEGRWVHVAGALRQATFVDVIGAVQRGSSMAVGAAGGVLLLDHDTGLVSACLGARDEPTAGFWHGLELPRARRVTTPLHLQLSGAGTVLEMEIEEESLLTVQLDNSALVAAKQAGERHSWIAPGAQIRHLVVRPGELELALGALGRPTLAASLWLSTHPISTVGEGLGPERLLAPGAGHAFRFSVAESGAVGLGVASDPDTAEVELLNAAGELVEAGVVQMHELEPGAYFIVVRAPRDGSAIRVRPAVVGLDKPPSGPPEELVRSYLELEGRTP